MKPSTLTLLFSITLVRGIDLNIPTECQTLESLSDIQTCASVIGDAIAGSTVVPDDCKGIDSADAVSLCIDSLKDSLPFDVPTECEDISDLEALRSCAEATQNLVKDTLAGIPTCVNSTSRALIQCARENADTCSEACLEAVDDFVPFVPNVLLLKTCNGIQREIVGPICETVSCCPACTDEYVDFAECLVNDVIEFPNGPCTFECTAANARHLQGNMGGGAGVSNGGGNGGRPENTGNVSGGSGHLDPEFCFDRYLLGKPKTLETYSRTDSCIIRDYFKEFGADAQSNGKPLPLDCTDLASLSQGQLNRCTRPLRNYIDNLDELPEECQNIEDKPGLGKCLKAIPLFNNVPPRCRNLRNVTDIEACAEIVIDRIPDREELPACVQETRATLRECITENKEACKEQCADVAQSFVGFKPDLTDVTSCGSIQETIVDPLLTRIECCNQCSEAFESLSSCILNEVIDFDVQDCGFGAAAENDNPNTATAFVGGRHRYLEENACDDSLEGEARVVATFSDHVSCVTNEYLSSFASAVEEDVGSSSHSISLLGSFLIPIFTLLYLMTA